MENLRARLVVIMVLWGCLLIFYKPVPINAASFPNDQYPHFGKAGACNEHMDNPTNVGIGSYTFSLCKRNSAATVWAAEIKKYYSPYTVVCSYPQQTVASPATFSCTLPANGWYKGYLYWWEDGSIMMTEIDIKYVKP
jgi:hypothetical protein